ncbi:hypothetical protein GCM10022206_68750 [Streptomyces chiangmaiensis]
MTGARENPARPDSAPYDHRQVGRAGPAGTSTGECRTVNREGIRSMAARHRRRTTAAALAAVAALTAVGASAGCDAVNKAIDCVQTADAIADSVTDLQQAVENAANDPTQTGASLDSIEKNLDKIGDTTDNVDVNKAVDDLRKAVTNVREAVRNGDDTPDVGPVTNAAGELTKVCTS